MHSLCNKFSMVLFFALLFAGTMAIAQPSGGNVIVINNAELSLYSGGSIAEFDSLNSLYNKNVLAKNELIISYKTYSHWFGHNNRDFITMTEVKSWEDVIAVNQRNTELFEEAWATEAERKAFNDASNKYFTGKHSDEIYQVWD
ncbi:MAG: hypothetical protein IH949_12700 [Bacteroidetes bacterium]|nr:hypothetical protein [Bacteroidota bacterium]